MPTYEYACPKCGHEFEQFQSMNDEPLKKCPKCKKAGVKRLVGSGAGLIFKGTGFYITDYKNKRGGKPEGGGEAKPSEAKPSESKPSESKASESKPSESKPAESKPSSDSKSSSSSTAGGKASSSSAKK
jgi:putative FmdB family regulatory protein